MHSMPPLVTISSAGCGAAPLQLLLAVDQVLAHARDALARGVLQRDPGLVAQQPRDDLVEVRGRERRRVGEAAGHRERAGRRRRRGSSPARRRRGSRPLGELKHRTPARSRSPRSRRADVLGPVRELVQRALPGARVPEDRALGAADRLGRSRAPPRSAPARRSRARRRRRTRCRRARRRGRRSARARSAARATRSLPERGTVPRAKAGSPSARSPATSRHQPSVTMPASPRRFASVANSSPNTASVPPSVAITSTSPGAASASAREHRQVVVVRLHREGGAGHAHVGHHRADRGIDDGQCLVGVAERRHLDGEQAIDHARDRASSSSLRADGAHAVHETMRRDGDPP